MKKTILLSVFCAAVATSFAQKETFDLISYTPPKTWKKQPGEGVVQFSKEDAAKGTYCMITLYKAVPAKANSKENFDLVWESLVKEMIPVSTAPEMQPASNKNGWEVQSGYAPFEKEGTKGVAVLVTSSGFEKMVNLLILTNTDIYEKNISDFLESISLTKPESVPQQKPVTESNKTTVIGTWRKQSSAHETYGDPVSHGNAGYSQDQYTFNENGTYSFVSKTFRSSFDKILLVKETGTYQINDYNLTINPQKSVIETWSKKDGTDKWGKLLNKQNRTLEKVTYQFTKYYFSGIQETDLVLQASIPTQRDGPFSNNTTFSKAWYYGPITPNHPLIELPDQSIITDEIKKNICKRNYPCRKQRPH